MPTLKPTNMSIATLLQLESEKVSGKTKNVELENFVGESREKQEEKKEECKKETKEENKTSEKEKELDKK